MNRNPPTEYPYNVSIPAHRTILKHGPVYRYRVVATRGFLLWRL